MVSLKLFALVTLLTTIKCERRLEIRQVVNGDERPIAQSVTVDEGYNVTLVCNLVDSDNNPFYSDDHLSWGVKYKHFEFSNEHDLERLLDGDAIQQFVTKTPTPNRAELHLWKTGTRHSGDYFCMSLKYKLFKIVPVHVRDLLGIKLPKSPFHLAHGRFQSDKCGDDKFICFLGSECYSIDHMCDGVVDCIGEMDENVSECGLDVCRGKKLCKNGRCIPNSSPCNDNIKSIISDENESNFWPPPMIPENYDTLDFNDFLEKNKHLFNSINNIPGFGRNHNDNDDDDDDDDHNNDHDHHHFYDHDHDNNNGIYVYRPEKKVQTSMLWFIVPCIMVVSVLIVSIMILKRCLMRSGNRRRPPAPPTQQTTAMCLPRDPPYNTDVLIPITDERHRDNLPTQAPPSASDLPPSYEEAVTNSCPSAPPASKVFAVN